MIGLFCFVLAVLASPFKSKIRLEAENATLRHQLVVLRRKLKGRAHITNNDRWFLFSSIAGFRRSCRFSRSSVPRRWCVGIGPAFAAIGAGNRIAGEGDRKSIQNGAN